MNLFPKEQKKKEEKKEIWIQNKKDRGSLPLRRKGKKQR
jgi:hypothetical protein